MAAPEGRVRRRCQREHRLPLRRAAAQAEQDLVRAVPRPGMGARPGAGGFRGGRFLRDGSPHPLELLRAHVPLFQRRPRPGVPRRERRVRLPGSQADIRVRRRGARAHRVRQRDGGRAQGMRRRPHDRPVRKVLRALRLRLFVLQPGFRAREGQRGEQGGLHQAQPHGPRVPHHQRHVVQQEPARQVHGAVRQGALGEGRAGKAAVRRGPLRHAGPADEALRGGAVRQARREQEGKGAGRRPPPLFNGPGVRGA